jgi:tetratricopeptide (TPR) repeat protein
MPCEDQAMHADDLPIEWRPRTGDPVEGGKPEEDRESPYALFQRGQALSARRHYAQAAIVLERANRLQPGKGSILELLGRAYFMSRQWEPAAETFRRLLELDPSAHYGHYALGQTLKRLGRTTDARLHLRLAVALSPGSRLYREALERLTGTGTRRRAELPAADTDANPPAG